MKKTNLVRLIALGIAIFSLGLDAARREKFSAEIFGDDKKISHGSREILVQFNYEIDMDSLADRLDLGDGTSSLIANCKVEQFSGDASGKTLVLEFSEGFSLNESSKYYITVKKGLRYVRAIDKNGKKKYGRIPKDINFYFVTSSSCPLDAQESESRTATSGERSKYIIISDIHMGDSRAQDGGYTWFSENITEMEEFLDAVLASDQAKELIIAGDLFDEWEMPVDTKPFEGAVTNSDQFFESVAQNPKLAGVIQRFNQIADSGQIRLVYVPGNHDMLMTQAAIKKIFPNIVWAGIDNGIGGISGRGLYFPENGICIEHGHIYDFYNAPDPYSHQNSLLPPGYFVSRMYATSITSKKQIPGSRQSFVDNVFFYISWELVLMQIFGTIAPDIKPIITDIDGYTGTYTYAQARDSYYIAKIGDKWWTRQETNGVYAPEGTVTGLLNGAGLWIWADLQMEAKRQYFDPDRARIVVFGHTHRAMMKGYNSENYEILDGAHDSMPSKARLGQASKIYANSGTWVNKLQTPKGYENRTYVVITPAKQSGTLDTVSLYQFNSDKDGTLNGASILVEELNIHGDISSLPKAAPLIR